MKTLTPCTYTANPAVPADESGYRPCICGLPKRNTRHELPSTSDAVREQEARRYGERSSS